MKRFEKNNNILPLNYGLSDTNGKFELTDSVDGSSFLNLSGKNTVLCKVRNIFDVLDDLKLKNIDLMKINIEGDEYPLLQHIADEGKLGIIKCYQIQFHNFVKDASKKRDKILKELRKSHNCTLSYHFIWENWQKK
ncbi:FkbM family methyltransferase [Amylibacter sp.]|nr:FkbM family methyltransferase [Amylibacter sp.]